MQASNSVQPARAKCGVGVYCHGTVPDIIKYAKTSDSVQPTCAKCGVGVNHHDSVPVIIKYAGK